VIITQNCWGASPKSGISLEGIRIFLEKILAKTPNPELLLTSLHSSLIYTNLQSAQTHTVVVTSKMTLDPIAN
jgi:hypothetical protein